MKLVIIMAAIMALACARSVASQPLDVCRSGPVPWVQECGQCGGRPDCLRCINDVFSSSRDLGLAMECSACINTANPGSCYKCIPNISISYDTVVRALECKTCANLQGDLAEGCSECLDRAFAWHHIYECRRCRNNSCYDCLARITTIDRALQCKDLP